MKIAILCPTRERPDRRKNFHNSVMSLSDNPDQVSVYYYIDNDDPELERYKTQKMFPGAYNLIGEPKSVSISWNTIAEAAISRGAEVLIMGNDDVTYLTKGWDTILINKIRSFPDKIYCAWFKDNINNENHCAFPVVSVEWVKCLGYFTPGIFKFGYNDTWVFDIAKKINREFYIPEIEISHVHIRDNTYIRNRFTSKGNFYSQDDPVFKSTENTRIEHANKLLEYIRENSNI